jgi:HEPN domain-containing protein
MSKRHEQGLLLLRKAEGDLALLDEVWRSRRVGDDIIGYHCQQAAEKMLKALLSELGVEFPRTHNLRLLMDLLADAGELLPPKLADLDTLSPYGTHARYEDIGTEVRLDRQDAARKLRALHDFVAQRVR